MRPSEKVQNDVFISALAELLLKLSLGSQAVLCLRGPDSCFEPTAHFAIDGVTEKVL